MFERGFGTLNHQFCVEKVDYMKMFLLNMMVIISILAINAVAQEEIEVGPNIWVSAQNRASAHFETRIAVDPANVQRLLACSMVFSAEKNAVYTIVYASRNGGASWTPTIEGADVLGDPDCVFGMDGKAYFVTLGGSTLLYRSSDGGWTWSKPLSLPFIDREYLTIDRTSAKYRGRMYLHGTAVDNPTIDGDNNSSIFNLFRSLDSGSTFLPPVRLLPDSTHRRFGNGNAEVLSDGTYVSLFPEFNEYKNDNELPAGKAVGSIKVIRSGNGGERFEKADIVGEWYACRAQNAGGMPTIAADHTDGPFRDRLYVVWSDMRSGHCDVRFSYSSDEGKTWSSSRVINDEPNRNSPERISDHEMPVVAVNNQGVVGIEWYDRRDSPDDAGWWVRFTASRDGGDTFLPSVRISDAPQAHKSDEQLLIRVFGGQVSLVGEEGGDTGGMAADANGIFHPLWVDNRTGILQLWTTSVSVRGKGLGNGDEHLAQLTDVTHDVGLKYLNTGYDPKTGLVSFDATLTNTSSAPISSPIKLRVIALDAASGTVMVVNADNHQTGVGAIWDFSGLLKDGVLKGGEKTEPKRFEFRIGGMRPVHRGADGYVRSDLMNWESKVFANTGQQTPSQQKSQTSTVLNCVLGLAEDCVAPSAEMSTTSSR